MSYPVYLDYNATTPLDPGVIEAIHKALVDSWGNPSSSYTVGQSAKSVIENARTQIAQMLNGAPEDIIFMSGGTEANNVALLSAITDRELIEGTKPHVITSSVEHDSVIKCLRAWLDQGKIELTVVDVDKENGCISVKAVISEIKNNTCLVSVMHANNETGIIMPISEIGEQLVSVNESRCKNGLPRIYFHTDAAQTIGKISVDVVGLNVDYLTVVGHKFYGPRIGALYVKNVLTTMTPILSLQHGGGQERGFRPGTENTPMIAGLGYAASLVTSQIMEYNLSMKLCRDTFQQKLTLCFLEGLTSLLGALSIHPEEMKDGSIAELYRDVQDLAITLTFFFFTAILFSAFVVFIRKPWSCYTWMLQDMIFVLVRIIVNSLLASYSNTYRNHQNKPKLDPDELDFGDETFVILVAVLGATHVLFEAWVAWLVWSYAHLHILQNQDDLPVYQTGSVILHFEAPRNMGRFETAHDIPGPEDQPNRPSYF